MGHCTFVAPYNSAKELEKILHAIKVHNSIVAHHERKCQEQSFLEQCQQYFEETGLPLPQEDDEHKPVLPLPEDCDLEEEVGEELYNVVSCKVIKKSKKLQNVTNIVMFGLSGSRDETWDFFKRRDIKLDYFHYDEDIKRLEEKSKWVSYDDI